MDFEDEIRLSRKRQLENVEDETSNKKQCVGMLKPVGRVIWDIFIQEPCIIEYPFFIWKESPYSHDIVYKQTFDHYGLFRVMGQCKVFKKNYPKLSAYDWIWHTLWNRNYVLKLYAQRKTHVNMSCYDLTQCIKRDVLFALKQLVLATQRKNFCNKKKAIAMLEL